jgi:hypothetical protein
MVEDLGGNVTKEKKGDILDFWKKKQKGLVPCRCGTRG